jgi:hypothetical protein
MSFLRRLLGGERGGGPQDAPSEPGEEEIGGSPLDEPAEFAGDDAEAERTRDRELAREEAERLDELQQRQLRFASYAWKPADQGGHRRADETDAAEADSDETDADEPGPH